MTSVFLLILFVCLCAIVVFTTIFIPGVTTFSVFLACQMKQLERSFVELRDLEISWWVSWLVRVLQCFSLTKHFEYDIFQGRQVSWKSRVRITDGGCKTGKKALGISCVMQGSSIAGVILTAAGVGFDVRSKHGWRQGSVCSCVTRDIR